LDPRSTYPPVSMGTAKILSRARTAELHPLPHRRRLKLTPPDPSEDELQATIASMLKFAFHGQQVVWTHFPAGGYLLSPAARARLTRLGLQPGFPDLLIMWHPRKMLWIELKTRTGRVSSEQQAKHASIEALEIPVAICRHIEDVLHVLRMHGCPMNKVMI
jgi:hypothetical protein